jgi:hypothetical protein
MSLSFLIGAISNEHVHLAMHQETFPFNGDQLLYLQELDKHSC